MADDEARVRKKQQKTSKKRPLKKFVTNVVSAITNAERFESLDYLARYSSLKILCSDFDSTYSSILSNYVISGSTEFRMIFKIVDKAEDVTLAVAKFTRNGFKLYPHSESFSSSSDDVDDSDLESESSAMIVKPKFVSVAQGGHVKVGEIYSNLHVPVYGVKCQEKNLYIIYHSSENEEKPIVTIRGKTDPSKWMAKSIGFSFSATSFKVYLDSSQTSPVAKIYPNIDFDLFDSSNKCAKFVTVEYKPSFTNGSDRIAILGAALILCVQRCLKEMHPILETYQKSQIRT